MERALMGILACPVCKGNLELNVGKENEREIVTSFLYRRKCNTRCPIVDAVPNLLPPDTRAQPGL